ncbi:MAG: hypothetical protein IT582_05955 [Opitutaceae bacterium]|nr:hypothetical protein [Opitutaceae bacterium]
MSLRATRIKLIWGASKVIAARWRFGLWGYYERKEGHVDSGLAISVRGLLVYGLLAALLAYVGGATAIYLWLDRREHNYVTYTDVLLLPLRMDEVREKRGQAYLDDGIAAMKQQRWAEGEMKLRLGLARYPQALKARLSLAEFYYFIQQNERALKVLVEGMDAVPGYPGRRYVTNYLTIAGQGQDYGAMLDACDRYLGDAAGALPEKERDWLVQQKLGALLGDGQYAAALAILDASPDNPVFNEQRVLVLIELGRAAEAEKYLTEWRESAGATPQILRLQVRVARELGRVERMNALLAELRQMAPSDPRNLAYAVVQQRLAKADAQAQASLEDYFFRFGGFAANTLMVAQPLAEIGAADLVQVCVNRATDQGYDLRPFLVLLAQAQLKQGAWQSARATTQRLATLSTKGRTAAELDAAELAGILASLAADPGEAPQVALLKYVESRHLLFQTHRLITETLMRAERYEAALEIIARAERLYPKNRALDGFKATAGAILAERKAKANTPGVGSAAPVFVESVFFNRVDTAIADRQWTTAGALIRDMQQARPSWLKAREADVLERQMRVARESQSLLEMTLAARMMLDGSLARAQRVVDYAVELRNQGDTEPAVLLLREVLRNLPAHALARRLLEEWTAPAVKPDEAAEAAGQP